MANDSESGGRGRWPGVAWPSALVVVVAMLAYVNYTPPLETARPERPSKPCEPHPRTPLTVAAVHARLWEDPLEAAYRDDVERHKATEQEVAANRCAGPAGILDEDFKSILKQSEKSGNGRLLVMPVLVHGGPYAEDREQRMRTRYAILAALGRCRYKLPLATRMSYVKVEVDVRFQVLEKQLEDREMIVPVKLYRPDSVACLAEDHPERFGGVLICWLNEAQLGDRPLSVVAQVIGRLFPDCEKGRIHVSIIGPTGSDTLIGMCREVEEWKSLPSPFAMLAETTVFSPRATAWEDVLVTWRKRTAKPQDLDFSGHGIRLIRAIGSDDILVDALREELITRDAWPMGKESEAHVALVTERDTLYGRALPAAFRKFISKDCTDAARNNLHVFTYLRGIDGALPSGGQNATNVAGAKPEPGGAETPEGRAQLDYLRRLEGQIAQLDRRLKRDGKGRIEAIGVVGTDFYDKLLVLRALRRRFPSTWFFTTDLDAGFTQAEECDHTRNLLVASHFGLKLHEKLQGDVPAFRDSYQTATYFAALLALQHKETLQALAGEKLTEREILRSDVYADPWGLRQLTELREQGDAASNEQRRNRLKKEYLQPLVFEIGRTDAYQLTRTSRFCQTKNCKCVLGPEAEVCCSTSAQIHPRSPRERPWIKNPVRVVIGAVCIFLCIWYFSKQTREVTRTLVRGFHRIVSFFLWPVSRTKQRVHSEDIPGLVMVAAFVLLVLLLVVICRNHGAEVGEPFVLLEGISVWPSTILRFLIIVLGVGLLGSAMRKLDNNADELCETYLGLRQSQRYRNTSRLWWRGLLKGRWCSAVWVSDWPDTKKRTALTKTAEEADREPSTRRTYSEYCALERWPWRFVRVLLLASIYYGFSVSLFMIYGPPSLPFRGRWSHYVTWWVTFAAVLVMIMLVFLVLDATQLCRRLIRQLTERSHDWPAAGIRKFADRWGAVEQVDLRNLLAIRLIAERTKVVSKTIWWPALIVFLMILSRLSVFDNWDFPWPLILLISLNLGAAVVCAIILRFGATKGRRVVLGRLRESLAAARGSAATGAKKGREAAQLELMIAEIEAQRQGAFAPLSEDPLLISLLMPFGGVGGLLFVERLLAAMP